MVRRRGGGGVIATRKRYGVMSMRNGKRRAEKMRVRAILGRVWDLFGVKRAFGEEQ